MGCHEVVYDEVSSQQSKKCSVRFGELKKVRMIRNASRRGWDLQGEERRVRMQRLAWGQWDGGNTVSPDVEGADLELTQVSCV